MTDQTMATQFEEPEAVTPAPKKKARKPRKARAKPKPKTLKQLYGDLAKARAEDNEIPTLGLSGAALAKKRAACTKKLNAIEAEIREKEQKG